MRHGSVSSLQSTYQASPDLLSHPTVQTCTVAECQRNASVMSAHALVGVHVIVPSSLLQEVCSANETRRLGILHFGWLHPAAICVLIKVQNSMPHNALPNPKRWREPLMEPHSTTHQRHVHQLQLLGAHACNTLETSSDIEQTHIPHMSVVVHVRHQPRSYLHSEKQHFQNFS